MEHPTLSDLRIDLKFAPGWSLWQCKLRKAFLVRFDEENAWVAAVNPHDVSITADMHWLTRRTNIKMAEISEEVLREAIELFAGR